MGPLNVSQVAELLELDRSTIVRWVKRESVQPVGKKGRAPLYRLLDILAVIPAKTLGLDVGDKLNLNEENAKLRKLQQDRIRLELEVKKENLLDAHEVVNAWADLVLAFRAKMLTLPRSVAPAVAAESNVHAIERLVKARIYEALQELADQADEKNAPSASAPEKVRGEGRV